MIRFTMLISFALIINGAFASDLKKEQTKVPVPAALDTNESIVVEHDLASHMGWSEQQAVFRAPRNFRTKELNELSPEGLEEDTSENSNN